MQLGIRRTQASRRIWAQACTTGMPTPLSSSHLQLHLSQHKDTLEDARLVHRQGKQLTDADVIKSLILMVHSTPWVAVLRGSDKLDMRQVAARLGVPRSKVRLATPEETLTACGYVPGTVPPLGHARQLPTLVDTAVSRIPVHVYGGGGDPDITLAISAASLIRHTTAQVLTIGQQSLSSPSPPSLPPSPPLPAASSQLHAASPPAPAPLPPSPSPLPVPWAPGSEMVELVGVVAVRRRIAKLLLFAMLLPDNLPALPASGQAVYLRRLWANPELLPPPPGAQARVEAIEVQLIMGKTLERRLGRQAAIELLDSIKPGVAVKVVGKVQPHGAGADGSRDQGAVQAPRPAIWDVVCHQVEVISKASRSDAGEAATWGASEQPVPVYASTSRGPGGSTPQPSQQQEDLCVWQPAGVDLQRDIVWVSDADGLMQVQQLIDSQVSQWQQQVVQAQVPPDVLHTLPPPVGVDCEWEPYARDARPTPVALMQVALRSKVFLIDMLALGSSSEAATHQSLGGSLTAEQHLLGTLMSRMFTSQDVTLLGFHLGHDIRRLVDSFPWLLTYLQPQDYPAAARQEGGAAAARHAAQAAASKCLGSSRVLSKVNGISYVDVLKLARATQPEKFLLTFGRPHQMSLSSCVQQVFGAPLDKTCQRSNWATRPLSAEQQRYAAADALSLVELHDALITNSLLVRGAR